MVLCNMELVVTQSQNFYAYVLDYYQFCVH